MSSRENNGDVLAELQQKVSLYLPIYGNCAQISFLVLQEVFDLEDGAILKALTPFPEIALRGETCGAIAPSIFGLLFQ